MKNKTTLWQRYIFGAKYNWRKRWRFWREYPLGIAESLMEFGKALLPVLFIPIVPILQVVLLFHRLIVSPLWIAKHNPEEVEKLMEKFPENKTTTNTKTT